MSLRRDLKVLHPTILTYVYLDFVWSNFVSKLSKLRGQKSLIIPKGVCLQARWGGNVVHQTATSDTNCRHRLQEVVMQVSTSLMVSPSTGYLQNSSNQRICFKSGLRLSPEKIRSHHPVQQSVPYISPLKTSSLNEMTQTNDGIRSEKGKMTLVLKGN